ncbi:unnamed protein product [Aureobasidium vineae]|uniref:Uncharacterized protein n=1 Tax=Aureobasidium vineae TaxID=2773715 RepID=A0A9N8JHY5_9PEZI|nr:unnamed protein product [Aureobasidium vineae]
MLSKNLISILALTSAVSASPALRRQASNTDNCVAKNNACRTTRGADGLSANQAQCSADDAACKGDCYAAYNVCRGTRTPDGLSANQAVCASDYASCLGENPVASTGGLISSFIPYSATASSSAAAATTYACNPAHSYPDGQQCISTNGALTLVTSVSTKASSTTAAAAATSSAADNCKTKDNKCRTTRMKDGSSANQAQCSAENAQCQGDCYAAYNVCRGTRTPDGLSANQAVCASEYASCLGENPVASTGGLISSFLPYSATASTMATSTAKASSAAAASSAAVSAAAPGSNPKKVDGSTWTLNNVIRYCADGSSTCDYNFDIVANGKTEHCTIVNASNKSFNSEKCANGDYTVSWGYVADPAPAFAVITVVDAKNELAWFGASNVDSQRTWGNLGPEQVYTYN